jgi:hypothetical protein
MPRKVQGEAHGEVKRHEPIALDNRDAPLEDRVVVWYRVPTEGDRQDLNGFGDKQLVTKRGEDYDITIEQSTAAKKCRHACSMFVTKVENYVDRADEAIDDGEKFAIHGESPFTVEIGGLIMGHLNTDDLEKKCAASRASESQGTTALGGTAETALSRDSAAQETATEKTPTSSIQLIEDCSSTNAQSVG